MPFCNYPILRHIEDSKHHVFSIIVPISECSPACNAVTESVKYTLLQFLSHSVVNCLQE